MKQKFKQVLVFSFTRRERQIFNSEKKQFKKIIDTDTLQKIHVGRYVCFNTKSLKLTTLLINSKELQNFMKNCS